MANPQIDDEDFELVPIPMGKGTRARLRRLAEVCGERPGVLAAKLMFDLLLDDEIAHDPANRQKMN